MYNCTLYKENVELEELNENYLCTDITYYLLKQRPNINSLSLFFLCLYNHNFMLFSKIILWLNINSFKKFICVLLYILTNKTDKLQF